jgi:thiosulfate/3-mercaptopyruvate sulfurtransferase
MNKTILIDATGLHELITAGECLVFDCRFNLMQPDAGRSAWRDGRIPGAVYAHLDHDLSSATTPSTGRHPLPEPEAFAHFLAQSGWTPGKLCVAYDGGGGFIAARLWWLMKYFSLDNCALLDGGIAAWRAAGLPLESGPADTIEPRAVPRLDPRTELVVDSEQLVRGLQGGDFCLLDARGDQRFSGEVAHIDSVDGHVPGARNHPCDDNLGSEGRLRGVSELRDAFMPYAGEDGRGPVIHMCGSGVTACHNQFAMELAGFRNNRIYIGSWSEWIRDPARPVALGEA